MEYPNELDATYKNKLCISKATSIINYSLAVRLHHSLFIKNPVVSDMWRTYAATAGVWFKNATQVIDKYHWIRQAVWAFETSEKQNDLDDIFFNEASPVAI